MARGSPFKWISVFFNVLLLFLDFFLCTATCSRLISFFSCSSPGYSYFFRECYFVLRLFICFKVGNDLSKPKSEHKVFSLLLTCHSSQVLVDKSSVYVTYMWCLCMNGCMCMLVCLYIIHTSTHIYICITVSTYIHWFHIIYHDSTLVFLILVYGGRIHSGVFPFPLCNCILPQREYWLPLFSWHTSIWLIPFYVTYLLQTSFAASHPPLLPTQCWHLPGICLGSAMEWICVSPQNSCVETLMPNMMVLGYRTFGR